MEIVDIQKIKYKNKDEKIFLSIILDKINNAYYTKENSFTDFLDPGKLSTILKLLENNFYISYEIFGGYKDAERIMVGFFRKDNVILQEDFNIDIIEISYNSKFIKTLSHRDYLGGIISLGLSRDAIGDIITHDDKAFVFVKSNISEYIVFNLDKIRNASVKAVVVNKVSLPKVESNIRRITVSSLRLDVIISEGFNLSRSKVKDFIKSEKVFINWINETNGAKTVKENSVITLRGKGRLTFKEIVGKSRKDKIVILVE